MIHYQPENRELIVCEMGTSERLGRNDFKRAAILFLEGKHHAALDT
jgi:hypothetical protein